ncbi:hypothetical protein RHECNPAF_890034 [Rhizobium etli CNPAF512]|nr:hypothetical protein RHECNPAF_890034 [Rhizobium etli CNPAF512]
MPCRPALRRLTAVRGHRAFASARELSGQNAEREGRNAGRIFGLIIGHQRGFPPITVIRPLMAYCCRGPAIHLMITIAGKIQSRPVSRK